MSHTLLVEKYLNCKLHRDFHIDLLMMFVLYGQSGDHRTDNDCSCTIGCSDSKACDNKVEVIVYFYLFGSHHFNSYLSTGTNAAELLKQ